MFSSTNYRLTRSNKSNASRHDVKKDKERRCYNDDDDDDDYVDDDYVDEDDEDDEDDKTDKSQTAINIKMRDGNLKHLKCILNPTHRVKLNIVCSVKTKNTRDATPDTCSTRGIYLDVASFIFGIGVSIAVYVMYNCIDNATNDINLAYIQ